LAFALLLLVPACRPNSPRSQAERGRDLDAALNHYGRLVQAMESDSIAALYTPDGQLGGVGLATVTGPDSIRAFLHQFDRYHVLRATMMLDSSRMAGDTGIQHGRYAQRVQLPAGDTVEVSGKFTAEWLRGASGEWRIHRMATAPLP
jgi:ketosteroid isomerase-like protein